MTRRAVGAAVWLAHPGAGRTLALAGGWHDAICAAADRHIRDLVGRTGGSDHQTVAEGPSRDQHRPRVDAVVAVLGRDVYKARQWNARPDCDAGLVARDGNRDYYPEQPPSDPVALVHCVPAPVGSGPAATGAVVKTEPNCPALECVESRQKRRAWTRRGKR